MKNLAEAERIAEKQRLTNVRYIYISKPDDDPVVVAVVGDRDGAKNVVFSTSAKTTLPLDYVSSLFEGFEE